MTVVVIETFISFSILFVPVQIGIRKMKYEELGNGGCL